LALKLKFKLLILLSFHFGISEPIFPTEATINEIESEWENQFKIGKLNYYSNYIYSETQNKFYTRFFRKNKYWSYGFRIGDQLNSTTPRIERVFLKITNESLFIQIGSYKINTGKMLSFGSDYGPSFQPETVNSLSKNYWSFKSSLSSTSNNSGLISGYQNKILKFNYLNDFSKKENYLFLEVNFINIKIGCVAPLKSKYQSIFIEYAKNKFNVNAEYLNNSAIMSIHKKGDLFQYFIHLRYYQPYFTPFFGKHFRRLNPDYGEKGVITSITRKLNNIKISTGIDFYNPIKIVQYKDASVDSRFYLNIISKIKNYEIGLDFEQRRFNDLASYYKNNLEFFLYQNNTYNKLGIYSILKKTILLKIQSIRLINSINQSQSYSFSIRHTGKQLFEGKLKFGLIKFSVPSWQVRTFNYQPGLPGEFILNAHNGNGVSLFSVYSLPISKQSNFHFRASIEKLKDEKITYKIGLQLNIGF
jgi:hypothetical protein